MMKKSILIVLLLSSLLVVAACGVRDRCVIEFANCFTDEALCEKTCNTDLDTYNTYAGEDHAKNRIEKQKYASCVEDCKVILKTCDTIKKDCMEKITRVNDSG